MHLRISILLTLIQIGHTLYDNPLIIGKCLNGQSIVKLKVSGTPSKICAPKCNVDQHCPSSLITAAKGRCIRVSKRDLCILGHYGGGLSTWCNLLQHTTTRIMFVSKKNYHNLHRIEWCDLKIDWIVQ